MADRGRRIHRQFHSGRDHALDVRQFRGSRQHGLRGTAFDGRTRHVDYLSRDGPARSVRRGLARPGMGTLHDGHGFAGCGHGTHSSFTGDDSLASRSALLRCCRYGCGSVWHHALDGADVELVHETTRAGDWDRGRRCDHCKLCGAGRRAISDRRSWLANGGHGVWCGYDSDRFSDFRGIGGRSTRGSGSDTRR